MMSGDAPECQAIIESHFSSLKGRTNNGFDELSSLWDVEGCGGPEAK